MIIILNALMMIMMIVMICDSDDSDNNDDNDDNIRMFIMTMVVERHRIMIYAVSIIKSLQIYSISNINIHSLYTRSAC